LGSVDPALKCVEFPKPGFDGVDDGIGCGRAGGDADGSGLIEPVAVKIRGVADVMNARAVLGAGGDEFVGIVAVGPADDQDDVALFGEDDRRGLALLGGLANGVNKPEFGPGKPGAQEVREVKHAFHGLCGLGGHSEARPFRQSRDILRAKDDIEGVEVFREAAHFDMIANADDDGVIAVPDELFDGEVGGVDEGAGGFDDAQGALMKAGPGFVRSAMGGDHDVGGGNLGDLVLELDSLGSKVGEDGFVVDQVA
jgi:hypothetical protein